MSAEVVEYAGCTSAEGEDPLPNKFALYDTKPSDGKTPVQDLWGMWSTLLLPLVPASL